MKIDHIILNVDQKYQNDQDIVNEIKNTRFPYEPTWGKGTKGFKVSNLWVGDEYLEMVHIKKQDGGGWTKEWTNQYLNGHRGLICLMIEVDNLDEIYQRLCNKGVNLTQPEWLEFKWFFNLFTRRMPWRNSYAPFFENVPFQIGFQEMKDDQARDFMHQYMVPNAKDHGINGIYQVIIKGPYSENDFKLIELLFDQVKISNHQIDVQLDDHYAITFERTDEYQVELYTDSKTNQQLLIENVHIHY